MSNHWQAFEQLVGVRFKDQRSVDFVLPDLDRDLERGMFITLRLAKIHPNPLVAKMYAVAQNFYSRLAKEVRKAKSGDGAARLRAHAMASFPEASEIGFGYTRQGWQGSGIGSGALNHLIIESFIRHPGMADACAVEPDALSFIDGVGLDRLSDAVATICKAQLIEYTRQQAAKHRFKPQCMRPVQVKNVWDPKKRRLITMSARLLVKHSGEPILLVPKRIVRSSPPVRAHHYRGPHHVRGGDSRSLKRIIMRENTNKPDKLLRAMKKVFEDPKRYRPRKEFQD